MAKTWRNSEDVLAVQKSSKRERERLAAEQREEAELIQFEQQQEAEWALLDAVDD